MKKRNVGIELILELSGCDPEILSQPRVILRILEEAAILAGATPLKSFSHKFHPRGFTGGWILAESSVTISAHTWPESKEGCYAALNFFTCGTKTDPRRGKEFLISAFGAKAHKARILRRGPINVDTHDT